MVAIGRISLISSKPLNFLSKCSDYLIILAALALLIVCMDTQSLMKNSLHQAKVIKKEPSKENVSEEVIRDKTSKAEIVESNSTVYHLIPFFDPPIYDEKRGKEFTDRWCVLNSVSWYPPSDMAWQLRAPYFMVPGAKKSGTTSLSAYITQHPLVASSRTKELQFFLDKHFVENFLNDDGKSLVREARQKMYLTDYSSQKLIRDPSLISMDGTPGYLFFSSMLPQRIFCVAPWIKLVIILRNPVDRVYSNWAYMLRVGGKKQEDGNLEKAISDDLELLRASKFLEADTSEKEEEYWYKYLVLKLKNKREGLLGRSFYEIQLRQWFNALRNIGRDPATQVHIVLSESLQKDKQGEMDSVYKFLGLPPAKLKDEKEKVVSVYANPMKRQTRKMLEDLFEPYNQRLYNLLDENGFKTDMKEIWARKTD